MPVIQSSQDANRVQKKKRNYIKTGRHYHVNVKYFEMHINNEVYIYFFFENDPNRIISLIQRIRKSYPNYVIHFFNSERKLILDYNTYTIQNEIKDIKVDAQLVPEGDYISFDPVSSTVVENENQQNGAILEQSIFSMLSDDPFSSSIDYHESYQGDSSFSMYDNNQFSEFFDCY